jgi:hypothetical protein
VQRIVGLLWDGAESEQFLTWRLNRDAAYDDATNAMTPFSYVKGSAE